MKTCNYIIKHLLLSVAIAVGIFHIIFVIQHNYQLTKTQETTLTTLGISGLAIGEYQLYKFQENTLVPVSDSLGITSRATDANSLIEILLPDSIRGEIGYVRYLSDGEKNIHGSLDLQKPFLNQKAIIGLDPIDFLQDGKIDRAMLTHIILHEFAHFVSVSKDQQSTDCQYFTSRTICLSKESYMYKFSVGFWSDTQMMHPGDFVSGVASKSVEEDFAESFVAFLVMDKPERDSYVHSKILFYYNFPDLIRIRKVVRDALRNEIGLLL